MATNDVTFKVRKKAEKPGRTFATPNFITRPQFPGGDTALNSFMAREMADGNQLGISQSCYLSFVVEVDSSLSTVKIRNCDSEEAKQKIRKMVGAMPPWIPGTMGSQATATTVTIPIAFSLR